MGYPLMLDEAPEGVLLDELKRRSDLRAKGLCDYCLRGRKTKPCKFPDRHRLLASFRTVAPRKVSDG